MTDERREALAAAFEEVERGEEGTSKAPAGSEEGRPLQDSSQPIRSAEAEAAAPDGKAAPQPDKDDKDADGKSRDQRGRFAKGAAEGKEGAPPKEDPAKAAAGADKQQQAPQGDKTQQQALGEDKPPVSWKPAAREKWSGLPAEAKQEIRRREQEIDRVLNQTAESRKLAESFRQVVAPFERLIAAEGVHPLRAVQNLLQTGAALRTGTQEQKARVVTDIIRSYGIDIPTLDAVLSNSKLPANAPGAGAGAGNPDIAALIDQRMAPFHGLLNEVQTAKQQRQQKMQESINSEIETFVNSGEAEFFQDVSADVADLLEVAARNGRQMSLKQAYERAIAMNPEVQAIVTQRKAAADAQAAQAAAKRDASSTIRGVPRSPGGKTVDVSDRRAVIADAWNSG